MRDRISTSGDKARERALFSSIASSIPNIEGQKVSMCFQALSGQLQSTHDLVGVVKGLTTEDTNFIDENCTCRDLGFMVDASRSFAYVTQRFLSHGR